MGANILVWGAGARADVVVSYAVKSHICSKKPL